MEQLRLFTPTDWRRAYPDPSIGFRHKFLMQGDSWFSIGALPPAALTTNMPQHMAFNFSACAVNYAQPGAELGQIVNVAPSSQWVFDPAFEAALTGPLSEKWDAILLSAGGNDLIAALGTPPEDAKGNQVPRNRRILLLPAEWGSQADASRYVSDSGWAAFEIYLQGVFQNLVDWRDGPRSKSQSAPIVLHSYCYAQPRPAGTGGVPGAWLTGPWLSRALDTYLIPDAGGAWRELSDYLFDRFFALLTRISANHPKIYLTDLRTGLTPAAPGTTGASGDWANEIHPTTGGYKKLAPIYCATIEEALANNQLRTELIDAVRLGKRVVRKRKGTSQIAPITLKPSSRQSQVSLRPV
ncbi:hypothetical protein P3W85_17345 [Cupriavidus basilensis]|uniref:SGNH hydrolase-type esterase domain-containing protein n=1 Tax=Cupriavidus basilensis TaxID=68895 RepID=A0ABT6AQ11_9BURK|nr:hypothetical protein [Cupriavidus basilensis]MDF3834711.1 hypothetical protein [Cupriavidus basilensis]